MSEDGLDMSAAERDGYIFRKSLPLQAELQEVLAAIGPAEGLACLEIGSANAMFSYQLRRAGGFWRSLVADERTAARLREAVEQDVEVLADPPAAFKDKCFDVVLITSGLETQVSDAEFVKHCHRWLKTEGRLIVCVDRATPASLLKPLRRFCRGGRGRAVYGYTERRLFAVLKSGFDVASVRTYLRFFTALVDTLVQGLERRSGPANRSTRFYAVAGGFFWIAFQLDALLFFLRGHRMIAVACRRGWRSREAPILNDGRSISEAVLKPIA